MLNKPILAECADRKIPPKKHPSSGEPEEWLADAHLELHGLVGLTFDFFVNWRTRSITNELWIKRVVDEPFTPWPITPSFDILSEIYQCDGEENVRKLCGFADRYGLSCHYFLFKESPDSQSPPSPVIEVRFDGSDSVVDIQEVPLPILKSRIRQLSGDQARVGSKGLTLGFTTLECYLSKTNAAWPGDADLVLVNGNFTPHAIIEFKKHTLKSPISSQKLSNYYPGQDSRKYDRLALFRDHLGGSVIVVIYYPTESFIDQVKLECIEGAERNLRSTNSEFVPLPNASDEESCRNFTESLLRIIGL